MKKKLLALVSALMMMLAMMMNASAYIDLGNGYVQLEYGDSYGSVGAAFDVNYYNLGYYNGVDPDSTVVHPGEVIQIGYASADSYYNGYDTGYTQNNVWQDSTQYYTSNEEMYGYDWNSYSEPNYYATEVYGSSYIATGYDYNSGYNANVACQLTDGVTLAPGETYYIDNYLGDGGYDMGFIDSECLDGNGGTFLAPGGGICSVSTAIHVASKDAGLTIVRRVPHNNGDGTTGVGYASAEDQASFNAGGANLIVQNNTDQTITLNTSYDGNGVSAKWIGNGGCFEKDNR